MTVGPLAGFTIGVTADRRAGEQADLLSRRGAEVLCAPGVAFSTLLSDDALLDATARVLDDPPEVVIADTAIGIRAWLASAEATGSGAALEGRLRATTVLARGPKAAGALRQIGVEPTTARRERLADVVSVVLRSTDPGDHVVIQVNGGGALTEVARLVGARRRVTTVMTYRWREPEDPDAVARLLKMALDGGVHALTFTSPIAVTNVARIADDRGLGAALRNPAHGVVAACVGAVTAAVARRAGFADVVHPEAGRLGLLVRCLEEALAAKTRRIEIEAWTGRLQGRLLAGSHGDVMLNARERAVMDVLLRRPGAVVNTQELVTAAWGTAADPAALHTAVGRLRIRLRPLGLTVRHVHRRGYRLVPDVERSAKVHDEERTLPLGSGVAARPVW